MHVAERMSASPWHEEPRAAECYWPLDPDQLRVCSLPPALGGGHGDALHVCHDRPSPSTTRANATWCGADIDARGNFRFGGTGKADASFAGIGRPLDKAEFAAHATRVPELNWGLMNFDNFPRALISVFQVFTLEGWVEIMYTVQDGASASAAACFFSLLVMLGSFFAINLTLAVLETNFSWI